MNLAYIYGFAAIAALILDVWIYNKLLKSYHNGKIAASFLYGWGSLYFVTMWRGIFKPETVFIYAKIKEGRKLVLLQVFLEIACVVLLFLAAANM